MTKKDYIKIAAVLARHNGNFPTWYTANDVMRALTNDMIAMLAEDNPHFDEERFLRAAQGGK